MKHNTKKQCATGFLVTGITLFLLCLILIFLFPGLYKSLLHKQITLVEGTTLYPLWKDIPLPIYERLYFFNITNAEEFLKHGAKLKVQQVGPYTYKGKWVKDPVAWNPNGTVSYREIRTYHFVPEQSSGTEDDVIITLNGPLITVANLIKNFIVLPKLGASFLLGILGENVIIERSIRQLVYGGYEDLLIKYAPIFIPSMPYKNGIFSWLYGKNDTDDGMFTVFTGENDIQSLNVIDKWNGAAKLDFWKGDTCNMINGSSGEMGPPLKDDQQNYTFFQSIFCRSLTYNYFGEQKTKGVKAKRFMATDKVFANSSDNPDNFCFQTAEYMPSGVQDVSVCQFGSPAFLSLPHFYLADPSYLDSIDGLNPQEDAHSAYIDVEPTIGISVNLKIRFQINLKIEKQLGFLQFQDIRDGVFPVFWAEIDGSLTDDLAKFLLKQMNRPKVIFYSVIGIVMVLSVGMIIWAIVVLVRLSIKVIDDDDPLLNPEDPNGTARDTRLCQEKQQPDGVMANSNACFGNSPEVSNPIDKGLTGSGTSENDVKLLDAAGTPDQPYSHSQGLRGGGKQ